MKNNFFFFSVVQATGLPATGWCQNRETIQITAYVFFNI